MSEVKKEKIKGFISQESFELYSLAPSFLSIQTLKEIWEDFKLDDDPNMITELEDGNSYDELVGLERMFRRGDGSIYAMMFVLPQAVEFIVVKGYLESGEIVKAIESRFSKDW